MFIQYGISNSLVVFKRCTFFCSCPVLIFFHALCVCICIYIGLVFYAYHRSRLCWTSCCLGSFWFIEDGITEKNIDLAQFLGFIMTFTQLCKPILGPTLMWIGHSRAVRAWNEIPDFLSKKADGFWTSPVKYFLARTKRMSTLSLLYTSSKIN